MKKKWISYFINRASIFSMIALLIMACSVNNSLSYRNAQQISKTNAWHNHPRELSCITITRNDPAKFQSKSIRDGHIRQQKPKPQLHAHHTLKTQPDSLVAKDSLYLLCAHPAYVVNEKMERPDFESMNPGKNQGDPGNSAHEYSYFQSGTINTHENHALITAKAESIPLTPQNPLRRNEAFIFLTALLAGFLSFIGIRKTEIFSLKVAYWARENPWKSRLIIVAIHFFMGIAAAMLGKKLTAEGIQLSQHTRDISLAIFTASSLLYPMKKTAFKIFRDSFLRRRLHNIFMVLSASILMVFAGNHGLVRLPAFMNKTNDSSVHERMMNSSPESFNALLIQQNPDQDTPTNQKPLSDGAAIMLTILVIIGYAASMFALLLLTCSLSCNGMEVLAVVVGILGIGLCTLGLLMAIKWINKSRMKYKPKPAVKGG